MSSSGKRRDMDVTKLSSECFRSVPATTAVLYPNPSDPFNQEAAALMMGDLPVYEQTVKEYCEKYAKPEDVAVSSEEKSTDEEPSEAESHSGDETVVAKPDL